MVGDPGIKIDLNCEDGIYPLQPTSYAVRDLSRSRVVPKMVLSVPKKRRAGLGVTAWISRYDSLFRIGTVALLSALRT